MRVSRPRSKCTGCGDAMFPSAPPALPSGRPFLEALCMARRLTHSNMLRVCHAKTEAFFGFQELPAASRGVWQDGLMGHGTGRPFRRKGAAPSALRSGRPQLFRIAQVPRAPSDEPDGVFCITIAFARLFWAVNKAQQSPVETPTATVSVGARLRTGSVALPKRRVC